MTDIALPRSTAVRPADCLHLLPAPRPAGVHTDADGKPSATRAAWLHGCGRHGPCTVDAPRPGVACCRGCPDYDPGDAPAHPPDPT